MTRTVCRSSTLRYRILRAHNQLADNKYYVGTAARACRHFPYDGAFTVVDISAPTSFSQRHIKNKRHHSASTVLFLNTFLDMSRQQCRDVGRPNTYFQEKQGNYHRNAPIKINQISRLPEPQIRITSTTYPLFSSFFYVTTVCKVRCHSPQDQNGLTTAYGS